MAASRSSRSRPAPRRASRRQRSRRSSWTATVPLASRIIPPRSKKNEKAARRPPFRHEDRNQLSSFFVVAVGATRAEADALRLSAQLEDIQPGPVAVSRIDESEIVDFDVVRHVPVRLGGVGFGYGYIEA